MIAIAKPYLTADEAKAASDAVLSGWVTQGPRVQEFEEKFSMKEDCENHLNIFLNKGLIESSNRLEEYCQEIDQIKITAFGKYLYEFLCFDFSYLDLICLDCGIYKEELSNYLIESASKELKFKHTGRMMDRIELRLERAKRFVEYLIEQEEEEAREINLLSEDIKYSAKLLEIFEIESERVRASASKRSDIVD